MAIIKRTFLVVLALVTVICFAACGDDAEKENGKVESASTASSDAQNNSEDLDNSTEESTPAVAESSDEEAPALIDYTVKVVDAEGNPVAGASVQLCSESACFLPSTTDAEGVVVFQKEEGTYKACIAGTEEYTYFEDGTEITIVYDSGLVDYTVKVVDAEGNPVAGASVQLCSESACFLPSTTDAEGVVVFQKEEGAYKACIAGTEEYTYFEDSTEITIVVSSAE